MAPGGLRVLVVDDVAEIRVLLNVLLTDDAGCDVVGEAEDGAEGVEKTEALRPDLVVMDMKMPVMDGLDATRAITSRWPHVIVVGFMSSGHEDWHEAMREAGAAASFEKRDVQKLLAFVRSRAVP